MEIFVLGTQPQLSDLSQSFEDRLISRVGESFPQDITDALSRSAILEDMRDDGFQLTAVTLWWAD
jgi:hypothetical protein